MLNKIGQKLCLIAPYLIVLFSTGCIVLSINPFYTEEYVTEIPEISGQWKLLKETGTDMSKKDIHSWLFTEEKIVSYDSDDLPGEFIATYFKVNDILLLDVIPRREENVNLNVNWSMMLISGHTLCKVEVEQDTLKLLPMNYDYLGELVITQKIKLKYETLVDEDDDDFMIFTAKPEEWIGFLKKNINDEKLFEPGNAFVLQRISE